jgi:acetyl-CoA synthetase
VFEPPAELVNKSNIMRFMKNNAISDYSELIKRSIDDIEWYWDAVNKDLSIEWFKPYSKILDVSNGKPWARWFIDGKCNITHNCVDRHIKTTRKDKLAYIWENENGSKRKLTYYELYLMVNKLANALKMLGIRKEDVVTIYMPMIPEAVVSMLACSKIGAIHSVVFSGFSAPSLATRLDDADAKLLITADGYYRRGNLVHLKNEVDNALKSNTKVSKVIVCRYAGIDLQWDNSRDILYDDLVRDQSNACSSEIMDSEDPLFILYTSGTTGRPKGTLHVHGSFMVFAAQQAAYLIDLKDNDVLFWPADIGWITGQTWTVYGSLILGSTAVIYDGAPDYPKPDTWFRMIENYNVTVFGASPTAIRLFMKYSNDLTKHRLDSLRILASTGEQLNPDEWIWFYENVGNSKCPIMNLSGGTEIGGAIVSPLPIMTLKPSTVGGLVPGIDADVLDESGKPIKDAMGYLVIKKPWPGMTRGLWKDPDRYIETYWSNFKDVWFHGDWALIDRDGFWYLHGRVDDVIKVAGHRIASAEIESVLASHPAVAEAAAISVPHEIKGETIVAYVVLKQEHARESLKEDLKEYVVKQVGRIARPEDVKFVRELPKTRTGKIVRRLIRAKLIGADLGDISNLDNPGSVEALDQAL